MEINPSRHERRINEARGAHVYVPRSDWTMRGGAGLRMLTIFRHSSTIGRLVRANASETTLLILRALDRNCSRATAVRTQIYIVRRLSALCDSAPVVYWRDARQRSGWIPRMTFATKLH